MLNDSMMLIRFISVICGYSCMFMAYHDSSYFLFKLNLMLIQLEHNVNRVMVPLNRVFLVQPHLPLWEGLYSVCCHASGRCLQRGKVMGVRYPGLVSRHNLVCPLLLWHLVPVWDRLCFATTVAVGCHWLTSGPPMT